VYQCDRQTDIYRRTDTDTVAKAYTALYAKRNAVKIHYSTNVVLGK